MKRFVVSRVKKIETVPSKRQWLRFVMNSRPCFGIVKSYPPKQLHVTDEMFFISIQISVFGQVKWLHTPPGQLNLPGWHKN